MPTKQPDYQPPADLGALMSQILIARAEVSNARHGANVPVRLPQARNTLRLAVERYTTELSRLRLPIPRRLHDEVRLLRLVQAKSTKWS